MSLLVRKIDVGIQLGTGDFGEGPAGPQNTALIKGLRVSANIVKAGMPSADSANIRIWGLTRSLMNQLTRLGKPLDTARNNVITLSAGDDVGGMSQVFQGNINQSYGDFNDPPSAALNINCISGQFDAAKPVPALSFPGSANVAVMMQQIAASMNKGFKNSGVSVVLSNTYLPGTAIDQMKTLATAADINVDPNSGPLGAVVEIWPRNGNRGGAIPKVSPQSGLVGYPTFSDRGCGVRVLYRPGFVYGGRFELESSAIIGTKTWNIATLEYELESELPGGKWFMNIDAYIGTSQGGAS